MNIFKFFNKSKSKVQFGYGKNILDFDLLDKIASENSTIYSSNSPYPHIIIDEFVTIDWVRKIAAEFSDLSNERNWLDFNGKNHRGKVVQQNKYHISDENLLGPYTQRLHYELKSEKFLYFLEKLTSIKNIIPDALNLGGGIHLNKKGAFLKIHADFNVHSKWKLDRKLNLLLYLNDSWNESFGGHLELWDRQMQECKVKILPIAGRCVIFSTGRDTYHGHPDPISCPDEVTRKSIALYYYANRESVEKVESHSTLWKDRPEVD